jgi:hypothetical protein
MVKIEISNKTFYTLVVAIAIVILAVGINAFGTSNPPVFGHSIGELAPPSPCNSNQYLQWTGAAWKCSASAGGITGSGHQGRVAVFTGGIETTEITDSRIWEDAGPLGWRMGFGGEPDTLADNDGIDVWGDINASGMICDGYGRCVGSGVTLDSTVYVAQNGNSRLIGAKTVCFLTKTNDFINNGNWGCEVRKNAGVWTLYSTGVETTCNAMCLN